MKVKPILLLSLATTLAASSNLLGAQGQPGGDHAAGLLQKSRSGYAAWKGSRLQELGLDFRAKSTNDIEGIVTVEQREGKRELAYALLGAQGPVLANLPGKIVPMKYSLNGVIETWTARIVANPTDEQIDRLLKEFVKVREWKSVDVDLKKKVKARS